MKKCVSMFKMLHQRTVFDDEFYFCRIYFIYDEFILFTEYEEFILFTVSFISCSLIQFSYYQALSKHTRCLIKYTIIKVGRLVIIFAESTIKLNFSGVCNCLTIKIFI